jgi:DNA-binding NarL/FixJ family response regulator
MDIEMPVMNGIETTFRIKNSYKDISVIMLTVFDNESNIFNAIKAGASGYLLKDEKFERMLEAFNDIREGATPMSRSVAKKALQMLVTGYKPEKQLMYTEEQEELSKRELEILELMADGASTQQMVDKLFISPRTLKKHIQHIYQKLHLKSRVELLLWYKQ